MTAIAGAIVPTGDTTVKKINWQNKRLQITAPTAFHTTPARAGDGAIASTDAKTAAVVTFPEAKADRIDLAGESIAAQPHLPLRRSGRAARKHDRAGAVVLRAADGHRCG